MSLARSDIVVYADRLGPLQQSTRLGQGRPSAVAVHQPVHPARRLEGPLPAQLPGMQIEHAGAVFAGEVPMQPLGQEGGQGSEIKPAREGNPLPPKLEPRHGDLAPACAAAAPARAAKIIANIPRAILATHSHTVEVMQLDYRESTQSPYAGCNAHEPWDGAKLQYAARAVFDYCERAGLRPYLVASHNYTYDRDYFTLLIPLSQPV